MADKNNLPVSLSPAVSAAWDRVANIVGRHKFTIGYIVIVLSVLPLLPEVGAWSQGDMNLYQRVSGDFMDGKLPYRDRVFEYPPYVIPLLLFPRLFGESTYPECFMLFVLASDWLMKITLLMIGIRHANLSRSLLPVLLYSLAVPAMRFFYLQRYDIWPALICVLAIWLFARGRFAWSGFVVAAGIGVKVYPAVFVPPLFILAVRRGTGKRFTAGAIAGILPMLLLGFFLPWWRFAEFHGARGLQVESLYASIIWLGKLCQVTEVEWVFTKAWFEITGGPVSAVLPWARVVFASTVIGSAAFAAWVAFRIPIKAPGENPAPDGRNGGPAMSVPRLARLARLLLVPLLAFVAFNQVLSPQYMIWLLPLAALASLEGRVWPALMIPLATLLTVEIFPTADYSTGLNLFETTVLVTRNIILIAAWAGFIWEWRGEVRK